MARDLSFASDLETPAITFRSNFPGEAERGTCAAFVNTPASFRCSRRQPGRFDRRKIVPLMEELNRESGCTIVLVTHDGGWPRAPNARYACVTASWSKT